MAKALRIYVETKDAAFASEEHLHAIAVHIPGTENVVVDALSRQDHRKALEQARIFWDKPFV